jgi:pimeloyl-ACP methyl ester carboxylesterase
MAALRNDCQASIATDALLATIAGGVYMAVRAGRVGVLLALASPVISPAAALALFAIWRELRAAASTYGADEARAAGATAVATESTGAASAAATATATTAAAAAAPPLRGRPTPLGGRLLPLRRGACHYYLDGAESDGPLVVLIHGMVGSGGYMGSLAGALSRGAPHRRRRVLRLDMPGRGLTECDGSPHTERSFAAHVAEALAQLGEDCAPVDVVGYSMGGAVAMAFAAGWPHLCRSVALLCAAGTSAVPMPRTLPLLLRMPVVPHILARRLVAAGALQGPHEWEAPHGPVWERHATEEARRACDERDTLARAVINTLLHFPMDNCEAHLAAVHHARIPVLAVWAEEDGIIPLASAARVRAVAPHAETIVVPGARHALPLERGPDVADMMLRWWRNAAAGRPRARSGATPSAATLSLVERSAIRARRNARSPRRR